VPVPPPPPAIVRLAAAERPGWTLVWSDEFNGTTLDRQKWVFETGGHGFGNHELEYYTDRSINAWVVDGRLVIEARKEPFRGRDYTSARLKTQGLFEQRYGRFEARIKLPEGQGIWPAFWMLGADIERVGWPECGEIDVMENVGKEPLTNFGSIHGPGYSGGESITGAWKVRSGRLADDFHVFAIEWAAETIRFYVDDTLYQTVTPQSLPKGARWVYDHPFFLLLNVAVGGDWPGSPDATTRLPQRMWVDYVRVYRPAAGP
jgi:beta-glucanase (GH16 family)